MAGKVENGWGCGGSDHGCGGFVERGGEVGCGGFVGRGGEVRCGRGWVVEGGRFIFDGGRLSRPTGNKAFGFTSWLNGDGLSIGSSQMSWLLALGVKGDVAGGEAEGVGVGLTTADGGLGQHNALGA